MEWISVKDKMPNDGCDVIIAFKWRGGQSNWSEIGRYDELKDEWYNGDGNLREVTHWMPLPEPPKEK